MSRLALSGWMAGWLAGAVAVPTWRNLCRPGSFFFGLWLFFLSRLRWYGVWWWLWFIACHSGWRGGFFFFEKKKRKQ
ncbi:hypothetical protein HOY80DRAFT_284725 [Tuber brumale]|nr:hypothetical protein HOY80DRAFT_284725 [Tuber brumale]